MTGLDLAAILARPSKSVEPDETRPGWWHVTILVGNRIASESWVSGTEQEANELADRIIATAARTGQWVEEV